MCRFLAYKGNDILMADLLMKAEHSLITQSINSRERDEPLNGDGFGVGWYLENDPVPCFFTSVVPAWSNANLHRISEKIRSSCFFAHVRAATSGLMVSDVNCHPFQHKRFLWMHNGMIGPIDKIRRRMRDSLSDEHYDIILGTSDSEHAFAVFLEALGKNKENPSMENMEEAMVTTIEKILKWSHDVNDDSPTYLNFAVTDGDKMLVSRFVSHDGEEPPSLYVSCGSTFELYNGDFRMRRDSQGAQTALVSSEPLTSVREDWVKVPRNHLLLISPENRVEMKPIELT